MSSIGISRSRNDAEGKVTGQAPYSGDLSMPGMLFMKTMFAERPHAKVRGIDTHAALAVAWSCRPSTRLQTFQSMSTGCRSRINRCFAGRDRHVLALTSCALSATRSRR